MGLLITFLLGIFIVIGAMISQSVRNSAWIEQLSISVAFGTMSALALFELLPEALEHTGNILALAVCLVPGMMIFRLLDCLIPEHGHAHGAGHECSSEQTIHIGIISSVAVILHNIIEGMSVYSVSAESARTGLFMALGVGLHNIPMGMVIWSTLRQEKRSRKTAWFSAVSLSAFMGGLVMRLFWRSLNRMVIGALIGVTLGMVLYIAAFELLPHLMRSKKKGLSFVGVAAGVAVILISIMI